jgi:coenzyme F420-0:L-glutamate ligase/coenzyme F420-1:gamma-L-glutamate ligase
VKTGGFVSRDLQAYKRIFFHLTDSIQLIPVPGIGEIHPGDDLARSILEATAGAGILIRSDDIIIVAQKVVSKAEGRLVDLGTIIPSLKAQEIATRQGRDPRLVEAILSESAAILRIDSHVLITETHHGFICANAGVDRSNVIGDDWISLLPIDPDHSARQLQLILETATGCSLAVIITDTFGRAWREGLTNVAIGLSGIRPLTDLRGQKDDYGKDLSATVLAVADEIAAASGLLMKKTSRIPVVILRGYRFARGDSPATHLIRPKERDLFR